MTINTVKELESAIRSARQVYVYAPIYMTETYAKVTKVEALRLARRLTDEHLQGSETSIDSYTNDLYLG